MVDISSQNNKINVTVSSSGNTANTKVTPDYAQYYSEKSKEWAISNRIIDNTDYSSKYYANESKKQADISTAKTAEVVESGNNAVSNIESARNNAITDITNQENLSVDNVNTAGATQIALATEQATIATNKASEVIESGNTALSNIDTAKDNAITSITNQEITSKTSLIDEGATQIGLIQNEGATQVANVQSTGFYMRDDKLYYINSQGQETEFKSGGGLELCDIGMALYVDEEKWLRRYLNGQIVNRNKKTEAFFTRLQQITTLHPSLLCTEEEWQTAKTMSAFGQVGKFVFNYADDGVTVVSVRIPAIVNVQGLFDLQNLGMTVSESLPNITGNFATYGGNINAASGAFLRGTAQGNVGVYTSGSMPAHVEFSASLSSSTYQDNAPVQQEAIQYPYFIQIATGSETENNIINEIELNNPYSLFDSKYSPHELNNLSWLKSEGQWNAKAVYTDAYDKLLKVYNGTETVGGLSVKLSTETYTDYDFVLNTADETFRLPLLDGSEDLIGSGVVNYAVPTKDKQTYIATYNGQAQLNATTTAVNQFIRITNVTTGERSEMRSPLGGSANIVSIWVNRGDTFKVNGDVVTTIYSVQLFKAEGNGSLYFYVGETVQNANLIDAGRIGEQLANKQDKCIHIIDTYVNGTSGYRIWSDGYCEQWGVARGNTNGSITFLKTFTNTNYNVSKCYNNASATTRMHESGLYISVIGVYNKTQNGFLYKDSNDDYYFDWKVSGYLAEGEY